LDDALLSSADTIVLSGRLFVGSEDGKWTREHVAITKTHLLVSDVSPLLFGLYGWRRTASPEMSLPPSCVWTIMEFIDDDTRIRHGRVTQALPFKGYLDDTDTDTDTDKHKASRPGKASWSQAQLELLPDHARRSRHSAMFPFVARHPDGPELLLACRDGPTMWQWCFTLRWRGGHKALIQATTEAVAMRSKLPGCSVVSRNPSLMWTEPAHLQEELLDLLILYTPYVVQENAYDRRITLRKTKEPASWLPHFKSTYHTKQDLANLLGCLVGACIHGGERNMELLLSLDILDLTLYDSGNSPQSMCCEGDYSPVRAYILETLLRGGSPVGAALRAGFQRASFLYFLCKPHRLTGTSSVLGQPVHPDDKEICKMLISKGVGETFVPDFEARVDKDPDATKFTFNGTPPPRHYDNDGLSVVPPCISNLAHTLLEIDLSKNVLTTLPDAFFRLKKLARIDLSRNLLFELSPQFSNFADLQSLNVRENLIERLPTALSRLEHLVDFDCAVNPICYPPQEVWSKAGGGTNLPNLMAFFRAINETGSVENLALKVMVLGRSEVGKTSLINAMIEKVSRLTRAGDRTVGIGQRNWVLPLEGKNAGKQLTLKMLDFAGQDEYYLTHHMYLTARAMYVIAFDLYTYKDEDFERVILFFLRSLQMRVPGAKLLIVGTHADMLETHTAIDHKCGQVVAKMQAWEHAQKKYLNAQLVAVEKDVKQLRRELSELKYEVQRKAGKEPSSELQGLLEELHTLRLPLPEVAPLSSPSPLERENATSQLLEKIAALDAQNPVPPTEAGATATDPAVAVLQQKLDGMHDECGRLRKCLDDRIVLPAVVHAVSSADGLRGIQDFREVIEATALDKAAFPQVGEAIPILFHDMREWARARREAVVHCSLHDFVRDFETDLGPQDPEVVTGAIHFLHDLGELLFFPAQDLVILSLAWLIDVMKYIIRHDHFEALQFDGTRFPDRATMSLSKFNNAKVNFLSNGILSRDLLEFLWEPLDLNASAFDKILEIMRQFEIVVRLEADPAATATDSMLLPPLLRRTSSRESSSSVNESSDDGITSSSSVAVTAGGTGGESSAAGVDWTLLAD
jgi:GTPase SAR1 family protein